MVEITPLGTARPNSWIAWSPSPSRITPDVNGALRGADEDALHGREIDDQAIVEVTFSRPLPESDRGQGIGVEASWDEHISDVMAAKSRCFAK